MGKAIPKGGRKGGTEFDSEVGRALRDRLINHARSIEEAENLDLDDFAFRALVVDDIWIPLGENVLIERFRPVWNLVLDGFGNKDPGNRRVTQYRSPWDVLYPGRLFSAKLAANPLPLEALEERLRAFYARGVTEMTTEEAMASEDAE